MTSPKDNIELNINYKSAEGSLYNSKLPSAGLISQEQINLLLPNTPPQTRNELFVHCNNIFPKYEINTPERISMWFAQCGHECGDFMRFVENLNYSAEKLQNFSYYKKRPEEAKADAGKPRIIANKVYDDANRGKDYKLGNTQTGDGWKFIGRGIIQITGRTNYTDFAKFVGKLNIIENPNVLETDFEIMVLCACWFFKTRNINSFADIKDVEGATKIINGGKNGLEDRQKRFAKCLEVFKL